MKKSITWAGIVTVMVMITALTAYGASEWPQFKGDMGHTGTVSHSIGASTTAAWTCEIGSGPNYSNVVLDDEGNIIIWSEDAELYSVSSTGSVNWSNLTFSSPTTEWYYWHGAAYSDANDVIYVCAMGQDPTLFCFDANTGAAKWSYAVGLDSGSCNIPTIGPDGTIYICQGYPDTTNWVGLLPQKLIAITDNGTTASTKWSVEIGKGWACGGIPVYRAVPPCRRWSTRCEALRRKTHRP